MLKSRANKIWQKCQYAIGKRTLIYSCFLTRDGDTWTRTLIKGMRNSLPGRPMNFVKDSLLSKIAQKPTVQPLMKFLRLICRQESCLEPKFQQKRTVRQSLSYFWFHIFLANPSKKKTPLKSTKSGRKIWLFQTMKNSTATSFELLYHYLTFPMPRFRLKFVSSNLYNDVNRQKEDKIIWTGNPSGCAVRWWSCTILVSGNGDQICQHCSNALTNSTKQWPHQFTWRTTAKHTKQTSDFV